MFRIQSKDEVVNLTEKQLLQTLIEKVTENRKKDHEFLAKAIANHLELIGALKTSSITQLIALAFSAGYYYKVFLSKNNVTVEIPDDTSNSSKDSN